MTSGGLTFEEALRLQNFRPSAPGPIQDLETIVTLLDVAGVCLMHAPSAVFTFEELMAELRSLLSEGQTIDDTTVWDVLPRMKTFVKVRGGWQWK